MIEALAVVTLIVWWLGASIMTSYAAVQRGRDPGPWLCSALIFSPIFVLLALIAIPSRPRKLEA